MIETDWVLAGGLVLLAIAFVIHVVNHGVSCQFPDVEKLEGRIIAAENAINAHKASAVPHHNMGDPFLYYGERANEEWRMRLLRTEITRITNNIIDKRFPAGPTRSENV